MQRAEAFDGLKFQDDLAIDDDIGEIAGFDFDTIIPDRQGNLLPERNSGLVQLMAQTSVIDGFKQPRPEAAMNAHRQPDNTVREVFAVSEPRVHEVDPTDVAPVSIRVVGKA
jgi:hypothetical protein